MWYALRSLRARRVSSAKRKSTFLRASSARGEKSPRFPIGVATRKSRPDKAQASALTRDAGEATADVRVGVGAVVLGVSSWALRMVAFGETCWGRGRVGALRATCWVMLLAIALNTSLLATLTSFFKVISISYPKREFCKVLLSISSLGKREDMSFVKKAAYAAAHPDLAWQIGKMVGKNALIAWGAPLFKGRAPLPSLLTLEPSNRCNLACQMCGRWEMGKNGTRAHEMPLSVYQKLLEELSLFRPFLSISGGEPTLYPELLSLLSAVKEKGLRAAMVTNGLLVEAMAEDLVSLGLDVLHFSLDGIPEVHDTVRRRPGAWAQTARSIEAIARYKDRQKKSRPFLQIIHVITEKSYRTIPNFLELCQSLPVQSVRLQHLWFATPSMLRSHNFAVPDPIQIHRSEASIARAIQEIDRSKIVPEELSAILEEVEKRSFPFSLTLFPKLTAAEVEHYYREPERALEDHCIDSSVHAVITSNGDVSPCLDYVAGNIQENPFLEIWNGEAYRFFRKSLKEAGGHFPYCTRCCGIFSHKGLP